jgi:hypothetical protein
MKRTQGGLVNTDEEMSGDERMCWTAADSEGCEGNRSALGGSQAPEHHEHPGVAHANQSLWHR